MTTAFISIWEDYYKSANPNRYLFKPEKLYELLLFCGFNNKMYLLDYGCGLALLSKYVPLYQGVELSKAAVEQAIVPIKHLNDLNMWKSYDVGISSSVFTHLNKEDALKILLKFRKCIKEFLLIDVWIFNDKSSENHQFYNEEDWLSLCKSAGFKSEKVAEIHWWNDNFPHTYYKLTCM